MRNAYLAAASVALVTLGGFGHAAHAAPFEPGTIPDQVGATGHLDVDALRRTQVFAAAGGQQAIDAALDEAPVRIRAAARTISRTIRGVSFWRDADHGAVYIETRDSKGLGQLVAQLPAHPTAPIDGFPAYKIDGNAAGGNSSKPGYCALYGDTLVLSDAIEGVERSIRTLSGKAASLAGSNQLAAANRQGVFVFVTVGDDMLGAIGKVTQSRLMQLNPRSLAVDVGEVGGTVTANAHVELRTADAVEKARGIIEGLRALASLSDDAQARTLLNGVSVSTRGMALDIAAKLPVADLVALIHSSK
jgi:hypothetical protein